MFGTVEASAALRLCCRYYGDRHAEESTEGVLCYLSVSNTINIITHTDVRQDWRGRGGAGCVEGLLGRMGVGGERWVRYQYTLEYRLVVFLNLNSKCPCKTNLSNF